MHGTGPGSEIRAWPFEGSAHPVRRTARCQVRTMDNPTDKSLGPPAPAGIPHRPGNSRLLAMLTAAEHGILYLVSFALLALAVGILALMTLTIVQGGVSGAEKIIIILEELLLVLIVLEIFVTVQTHLEGGRLQLEP